MRLYVYNMVCSSLYHAIIVMLDNESSKIPMLLEFERRPLGDTLGVVIGDTTEWPGSLGGGARPAGQGRWPHAKLRSCGWKLHLSNLDLRRAFTFENLNL